MEEKPELLENPTKPEITEIKAKHIRVEIPGPGETSLILQCNARDDRELDSPDIGRLKPEQTEKAQQISYNHFKKLFEDLSPEERQNIDILVVASNSTLNTETGIVSSHKRAVETGDQVIFGLQQVLSELNLSPNQLINTASAEAGQQPKPYEVSELRDLKMMDESPEFVQFLVEKEGAGKAYTGTGFWNAYETDKYKDVREKMGAEGPLDIADRMAKFMTLMALISAEYHQSHPDKRLVIWAISHYDSISPFIKKHINMMDDHTALNADMLDIEKTGGLTFKFDKDGKLSTELQDQMIDLSKAV